MPEEPRIVDDWEFLQSNRAAARIVAGLLVAASFFWTVVVYQAYSREGYSVRGAPLNEISARGLIAGASVASITAVALILCRVSRYRVRFLRCWIAAGLLFLAAFLPGYWITHELAPRTKVYPELHKTAPWGVAATALLYLGGSYLLVRRFRRYAAPTQSTKMPVEVEFLDASPPRNPSMSLPSKTLCGAALIVVACTATQSFGQEDTKPVAAPPATADLAK